MNTSQRIVVLSLLNTTIAVAAKQPNIIYIMTDQQTATALSYIGNSDLHTPNLDRLAAAGMLFDNAYCTSPLSGPSRAAMFTGHYPSTIGLSVNNTPMAEEQRDKTLGTLLSNVGYECVYGGKWHVHTSNIPDGEFGFKHICDQNDLILADACVDYLSSKPKSPFFMVASFDNPHNICEYARSQNLPYGNIEEPDLRDCPGVPANFAVNPYDADVLHRMRLENYSVYPTMRYEADDWRRYRYTYYRLVEKVDAEIGKIIDAIDANNLWENTVVIFSSDHGDGVGAHQWNQKSALYEESANVPFIVTLPKKKNAGKEMPQLINSGIDLFASICDWAGATPPEGTTGVSFKKLVEKGDNAAAHQEYVITETQFDGSVVRGWMVRSANFKYILYDRGLNREQLYDMVNDRGEMRNLVVEDAYSEELNKHRDILHEWLEANNIRTTRKNLKDVPNKKRN